LTQQQIGARVGLSRMRVSHLLRSSLARLRAYVEARGGSTITVAA
jgi:DNA-directed RNA polymerase specialized sigma subunit